MIDTADRLRNPGMVWRSEMREAAAYHEYRGEMGEADGWLFFRNQEGVPGEIALAVGPGDESAPWFLAVSHPGVAAELNAPRATGVPGQYAAAFVFADRGALREAILRTFHLARSVPSFPLTLYLRDTAHLGNTETDRIVKQRIGQDRFRSALLDYWNGQCPLSGITEPELLRASHIVPWAECMSDEQRLDVHNGLLLAAHWDAAFDGGLVGFTATGTVIFSVGLSDQTRELFKTSRSLPGLTAGHRCNLLWHRAHFKLSDAP